MKKNLPLYLYGAIIILEGAFLLFSRHYSFQTIKFTLGITLIIGAILGFLTAFSRQRKKVEFLYHEIHALAMLVYGVSVLLFADTLETLAYLSAFMFLFYSFSEIIFCNWLFNLKRDVVYKIVLIRVLLGLIVGAGTIFIMHYYKIHNTVVMDGYGALFIIIGINIMLYVPIMKESEEEFDSSR